MKVYTKKGDDGTTGLFYGGRVAKDSELPTAYGSVDEAQAVIGLARAHATGELDDMLVAILRDLWVLMAELATLPENRGKLEPGATAVTPGHGRPARAPHRRPRRALRAAEGVRRARAATWRRRGSTWPAPSCAGPSGTRCPPPPPPSLVVPYLNRLSDLLWTMARLRDAEDGSTLRARDVGGDGQTARP